MISAGPHREEWKLILFKHEIRFPFDDSWAEMPSIRCRILQMNFLYVCSSSWGGRAPWLSAMAYKNVDVLSFMSYDAVWDAGSGTESLRYFRRLRHTQKSSRAKHRRARKGKIWEWKEEPRKSNILDIFWALLPICDKRKTRINFMKIASVGQFASDVRSASKASRRESSGRTFHLTLSIGKRKKP